MGDGCAGVVTQIESRGALGAESISVCCTVLDEKNAVSIIQKVPRDTLDTLTKSVACEASRP